MRAYLATLGDILQFPKRLWLEREAGENPVATKHRLRGKTTERISLRANPPDLRLNRRRILRTKKNRPNA